MYVRELTLITVPQFYGTVFVSVTAFARLVIWDLRLGTQYSGVPHWWELVGSFLTLFPTIYCALLAAILMGAGTEENGAQVCDVDVSLVACCG